MKYFIKIENGEPLLFISLGKGYVPGAKQITKDQYDSLTEPGARLEVVGNAVIKKKTNPFKKKRQVQADIDWRTEINLEKYYSASQIKQIVENRKALRKRGKIPIPHAISPKKKTIELEEEEELILDQVKL